MERNEKKQHKGDKAQRGQPEHHEDEGPFKIVKHANENEWERFQAFCAKTHKHHSKFIVSGKEGHPWVDRVKGDSCFSLSGRAGGILYVIRGKTYHLSLGANAKRKLMLTTDPCGGKQAKPLTINGVACPVLEPGCTLSFRVGKEFPNSLYYQDVDDEFLGGLIVVQKPYKHHDHDDHDHHDHNKF